MKSFFEKASGVKTRLFITINCIGFLFITGCKLYCPAFPDHLVDYFPYKMGDTLSFINQHNDTIAFYINFIIVDKEHTTCRKCDGCDGPVLHIATGFIRMDISIFANKTYMGFSLSDRYWEVASTSVSTLWIEEFGKNPFDSKNSALFGETVIIEDSGQQISKVIIVKGKGITEFFDQKYNFQWNSNSNK